jgi:hypothetical protein
LPPMTATLSLGQHGPPLLGRVRAPPRSLASPLLCRPPTPCPHQPRLRFPLPVAYLDAGACSVPGGQRHVRLQTRRASETTHRLSAKPEWVEARRGPPRCLGRPLRPCHGRTPRWRHPPPRPPDGEDVRAFRYFSTLGLREGYRFRGRIPMAHTLACLRFADPISEIVARLATSLGGLTLSRTGFAPAGRRTKFHEGIATSNSL